MNTGTCSNSRVATASAPWRSLSLLLCLGFGLTLAACEPDLEEGKVCSVASGDPCAPGYACVRERCTEVLARGQECNIGNASTGAVPCAEGLVCRAATTGKNTCQASSTQGGACLQDSDCVSPSVCRKRSASATASCEALAAFGAFCEATSDCESGLTCATSSVDGSRACE